MVSMRPSIFNKIKNFHQFGIHSCQQIAIIQCTAVPPLHECSGEIGHHQIFGLVVSDFAKIFVQGFLPQIFVFIPLSWIIFILGSYIYDVVFAPLFKLVCVVQIFSLATPVLRTSKFPQHPCRFRLFPHLAKLRSLFSLVPKRMVKMLQFDSDAIEKVLVVAIIRPFIPWFSFAHNESHLYLFPIDVAKIQERCAGLGHT